jgi:hypothetical protein
MHLSYQHSTFLPTFSYTFLLVNDSSYISIKKQWAVYIFIIKAPVVVATYYKFNNRRGDRMMCILILFLLVRFFSGA